MVSKLVEYHIQRLKDKDPAVRLRSINELRLLGDLAALPALEQVFRNDSDPEVRKAAKLAGREIYDKHAAKGSQKTE
ncbi:MAG: HEAT repeat domain-containing protein [Anaerolineae bacterium]|nr:HEAT repeat domain-containing protein [Anaerolineae bacterium]MDW8299382.1 HEAT repeat domain-containing protein [Anaerolineae bacterium]